MIKEKPKHAPITIDLTGPQGNAFFLLAQADRFAGQLGLDRAQVAAEMTESDYDNLVKVFDRYFGDFVVLLR